MDKYSAADQPRRSLQQQVLQHPAPRQLLISFTSGLWESAPRRGPFGRIVRAGHGRQRTEMERERRFKKMWYRWGAAEHEGEPHFYWATCTRQGLRIQRKKDTANTYRVQELVERDQEWHCGETCPSCLTSDWSNGRAERRPRSPSPPRRNRMTPLELAHDALR